MMILDALIALGVGVIILVLGAGINRWFKHKDARRKAEAFRQQQEADPPDPHRPMHEIAEEAYQEWQQKSEEEKEEWEKSLPKEDREVLEYVKNRWKGPPEEEE